MITLILTGLLRGVRTQRSLVFENLALRHQLAVLQRTASRPRLRTSDRLFWVLLSRLWSGWTDAVSVVAHGEAGGVFAIDVSRMARSSEDWRRLLVLWTSSGQSGRVRMPRRGSGPGASGDRPSGRVADPTRFVNGRSGRLPPGDRWPACRRCRTWEPIGSAPVGRPPRSRRGARPQRRGLVAAEVDPVAAPM